MEIYKVGDEFSISGYKSITLVSDMETNINNFAEINDIDKTVAKEILNSNPAIQNFLTNLTLQDEEKDFEIIEDFQVEDLPLKASAVDVALNQLVDIENNKRENVQSNNAGENTTPVNKTASNATSEGKRFINGVAANGCVDGKYYQDGVLVTGVVTISGTKIYCENGIPTAATVSGVRYGDDGKLFTGEYNSRQYYQGKVVTGVYNGVYYKGGVQDITFTGRTSDVTGQTRGSIYCENGVPANGLTKEQYRMGTHTYYSPEKFYYNGVIANGCVDGKYYQDGALVSGVVTINNTKIYCENGIPTAGTVGGVRYGDDGQLFTGEYNSRQYYQGKVVTGVYNGVYHKDGVPDITFKGKARNVTGGGSLYCEDGKPVNGLAQEEYRIGTRTYYSPEKFYYNGVIANGCVNGEYYEDGILVNGITIVGGTKKYTSPNNYVITGGTKIYCENGIPTAGTVGGERYGDDGKLFTGEYNSRQYYQGKVVTGVYNGVYHKDGVPDITFKGKARNITGGGSLYCEDGKPVNGLAQEEYRMGTHTYYSPEKFYNNGVIANGCVDGKYYQDGILVEGVTIVGGTKKYTSPNNYVITGGTRIYCENGIPTAGTVGGMRYGDDGKIFTGEYNSRQYYQGKVVTGVYNGVYYKGGVPDITFTGFAYDVTTKKSLYCENGLVYTSPDE